jgi:hypothetical protein
MATLDITDVRPNGNSFAEGRLNPPDEVWAPPLAPNGTTAAGHVLLREETFRPVAGGEDSFEPEAPFEPLEPNNLYETNPSETFGARRKLIAGTAILAALGVAGLTYFFLASPGAKAPAETSPIASSPTAVESSSKTQVQPAPTVAEPSPGASGVVPSPDVAAPLTAAASPQIGAVTPQTTSTAQNPDLVFLQRPGVNIRSAPSANAPVLGTAPRGTQFTATGREGDWVQVENTRLKGWVNSQFLAPDKPQ